MSALPGAAGAPDVGDLLAGRYAIRRLLGQGGTGSARAALAEAEALASRAGAGGSSELGREITAVRALLRGEAP